MHPPDGPRRSPAPRPLSPCINVCVLGEDGLCNGCFRDRREIGGWSGMSAAEQWQVLERLEGRRLGRRAEPNLTGVNDMSVTDRIKQHLATRPVVLFMKGTPDFPQCGFSAQTVGALREVGAEFHAVNIFEDPELRDELKRYSNWPTYPQLYVNGELIGGCDIALEMYQNGELKSLLTEAGAVAA